MIRIVVADHLIHVEEVAVAVADNVFAEALDGIFEVEIDGIAGSDTVAGVAALLGGAAGDIARAEVTESRVAALEIEVAVFVGDVGRFLLAGADSFGIFFLLRNPDAAVVAERFAHEGQLRLVFAVDGNTGRMDLCERQVGQICAAAEGLDGGRAVAAHGVCREEEGAAVTAGCQNNGVGGVALKFAGDEVTHDDTAGATVDDDEVEHLAAVERAHGAFLDLAVQRAVGTEKELLAGLAFGLPGRRRTSGWREGHRIRVRREHPGPHTGR